MVCLLRVSSLSTSSTPALIQGARPSSSSGSHGVKKADTPSVCSDVVPMMDMRVESGVQDTRS